MANSCGRVARGDVGRERFAVMCKMLLVIDGFPKSPRFG